MIKKPSNFAVLNRPTLEYSLDFSFAKHDAKFVESIKSAEKYEFTKVVEYSGTDKTLQKEIFEPVMQQFIVGNNRRYFLAHANSSNL